MRKKTTVPMWRVQGLHFQKWRAEWLVPLPLRTRYTILENRILTEWIDAYGLLTRNDLIGIVGRWGRVARHALQLIEHSRVAPLRGWHLCNTAISLRWKCTKCHETGHLVPRVAWLEQTCSLEDSDCTPTQTLALEHSEARAVQAHMSTFLKKCQCT